MVEVFESAKMKSPVFPCTTASCCALLKVKLQLFHGRLPFEKPCGATTCTGRLGSPLMSKKSVDHFATPKLDRVEMVSHVLACSASEESQISE